MARLNEEQTAPCQHCKGAGRTGPVHANRGPDKPGEWRGSMPCRECDGTGTWSMGRWERWHVGQDIKAARLARYETLYEASQRLGVSPAELSAIERGHEPQTEAGRRALAEKGAEDE